MRIFDLILASAGLAGIVSLNIWHYQQGARTTAREPTEKDLEYIKGEQAKALSYLEALTSGHLHIGAPFDGRTEAKIAELHRRIEKYQLVIDRAIQSGRAGGQEIS